MLTLVALGGGLFGYFISSPSPEVPRLSGTLTHGAITVGGLERTYLLILPQGLPKGSPLVMVMHGSGENGARIRSWTGYGFERLADRTRLRSSPIPMATRAIGTRATSVGDFSANRLNIDDVGFLTALADKLVGEIGVDPAPRLCDRRFARRPHGDSSCARSAIALSRGRRGIGQRAGAGQLQMQARQRRHLVRS